MSGVRFSVALLAALALSGGAFGQNAPERFWLAGLYDGNRVVIYFDAVKLGLTSPPGARSIPPPPGARKIAPPAAFGFFDPMELAPDYVAGLQKKPGAERFAVGDRYDLLMGRGEVTTVKVTTLVGCPGDEQTGNDSYIGALAKLERSNSFLPLSPAYYLVRRHREAQSRTPGSPLPIPVIEKEGGLIDAPAAFDIETKIARIMDKQMTLKANAAERALAGAASPALSVQQFRIAGGDIRYYVRAVWKSGRETKRQQPYSLGAWISSAPEPRLLALEARTTIYGDFGLPQLLNAVSLGSGTTGIIARIEWLDSAALRLLVYRDGVGVKNMRVLQDISAGE